VQRQGEESRAAKESKLQKQRTIELEKGFEIAAIAASADIGGI
jgi:hypothetical protein